MTAPASPPRFRHDGGECPVAPETVIVGRYRNGQVFGPVKAGQRRWKLFEHGKGAWDIVAWRWPLPGELA